MTAPRLLYRARGALVVRQFTRESALATWWERATVAVLEALIDLAEWPQRPRMFRELERVAKRSEETARALEPFDRELAAMRG